MKFINVNDIKKEIQDLFGKELCKVQTDPEYQVKFLNEINVALENVDFNTKIKTVSVLKSIFS